MKGKQAAKTAPATRQSSWGQKPTCVTPTQPLSERRNPNIPSPESNKQGINDIACLNTSPPKHSKASLKNFFKSTIADKENAGVKVKRRRRSAEDKTTFHIRSKGGQLTSHEQLRDALHAENAFIPSMCVSAWLYRAETVAMHGLNEAAAAGGWRLAAGGELED
jgi:hypothetical protein